ncbi:MAG: NAD(P)-binding domain-containing protein [Chloroflexi bacterium]|nr:NAD(P)-binding domain-containing protein [Chloroflexota bacterium]
MKILIASSIDADTIATLRKDHDVVCDFHAKTETLPALLKDREVLIFRSGISITAEVMASAPQLKLLVRAGSGFDNIDMDYVQAHNLALFRIPEPGAKAVAEMSFALMLTLARNILEADRLTKQGRWAKNELTGYALTGRTLGIVGAGNIGSRVGELGVAWGMRVIGCVANPSAKVLSSLHEKGIRLTSFDEVIETADYVSLHVPLSDSTRNMINADVLGRMKPGAFLINLARGGVVDELALYQALTEGQLRGAGMDVHKAEGEGKISPLAGLSNVILTPHIGAGTFDAQREIGERIVEIIETFVAEQAKKAQAKAPVVMA